MERSEDGHTLRSTSGHKVDPEAVTRSPSEANLLTFELQLQTSSLDDTSITCEQRTAVPCSSVSGKLV
jgi:hypothetical protein